jgi:hypothetical protein
MTNLGQSKEYYDSLLYKLATLESELGQARKLLEATPAKRSLWRRIWGRETKALVTILVLAVMVVGAGGAGESKGFGVYDWKQSSGLGKLQYVIGYNDGMAAAVVHAAMAPARLQKVLVCIKNWNMGQQIAVIEKYLKDNPQKWDIEMNGLIFMALEDACNKR